MKRVIVYIDGFNLYYGLRSKGWKWLYWLNVQEMARRLLQPEQTLVKTLNKGRHRMLTKPGWCTSSCCAPYLLATTWPPFWNRPHCRARLMPTTRAPIG